MRLALTHCDNRPADHFDSDRLGEVFIRALFGVTDLFRDELTALTSNPR
jgi:hypothetical protein